MKKTIFNLIILAISFSSLEPKKIILMTGTNPFVSWLPVVRSLEEVKKDLEQALRKHGYRVEHHFNQQVAEPHFNLIVCNDACISLKNYQISQSFLFLWEPPIHNITITNNLEYHKNFKKVFTVLDDLVDNELYFKFYYPRSSFEFMGTKPFKRRLFCTLMARNKPYTHEGGLYAARREWAYAFDQISDNQFHLYGEWWPKDLKSYKGSFKEPQINKLSNYKFCICFENTSINGYISEKIWDALISGCIPVYRGPDNITDYIPANCFIDARQFKTPEEAYFFLIKITPSQYNEYIKNIKAFLKSDKIYPFTTQNFIKNFLKQILNH